MAEEEKAVIPLHKPSSREKIFFFSSGIIMSVPLTLFIDQFASNILSALPQLYAILVSSVVLAPFLEEFAKAFPLFYRHGETERSIFTLGFLVGLGFGIFEFFVYVFLLGAPIVVRLPAIFFHGASTSITTYGIAKRHTTGFYLIAVGLHLSINASAFLQAAINSPALFGWWSIGTYLATAITYLLSWGLYNKTKEKIAY
jgi:hypothetical protein